MIDRLKNDLKEAQLARDGTKVSTLRLLISEIKNAEIAKGPSPDGEGLSDEDIISIIQKEVKKRHEAASGFRVGEREEQALKEEAELEVLKAYLPQQLSNEELTKIVETTITEVGATGITDMGRVIGLVMGKVKGQADGGTVSGIVKEKLS